MVPKIFYFFLWTNKDYVKMNQLFAIWSKFQELASLEYMSNEISGIKNLAARANTSWNW